MQRETFSSVSIDARRENPKSTGGGATMRLKKTQIQGREGVSGSLDQKKK